MPSDLQQQIESVRAKTRVMVEKYHYVKDAYEAARSRYLILKLRYWRGMRSWSS